MQDPGCTKARDSLDAKDKVAQVVWMSIKGREQVHQDAPFTWRGEWRAKLDAASFAPKV